MFSTMLFGIYCNHNMMNTKYDTKHDFKSKLDSLNKWYLTFIEPCPMVYYKFSPSPISYEEYLGNKYYLDSLLGFPKYDDGYTQDYDYEKINSSIYYTTDKITYYLDSSFINGRWVKRRIAVISCISKDKIDNSAILNKPTVAYKIANYNITYNTIYALKREYYSMISKNKSEFDYDDAEKDKIIELESINYRDDITLPKFFIDLANNKLQKIIKNFDIYQRQSLSQLTVDFSYIPNDTMKSVWVNTDYVSKISFSPKYIRGIISYNLEKYTNRISNNFIQGSRQPIWLKSEYYLTKPNKDNFHANSSYFYSDNENNKDRIYDLSVQHSINQSYDNFIGAVESDLEFSLVHELYHIILDTKTNEFACDCAAYHHLKQNGKFNIGAFGYLFEDVMRRDHGELWWGFKNIETTNQALKRCDFLKRGEYDKINNVLECKLIDQNGK
jgi:hypothetical protein